MSFAWPRYLAWARMVLASVALIFSLFLSGTAALLFYGVMGLYLAYSVVVAVRGRAQTGMVGLMILFGDTVYFLIIASSQTEPVLWLASAFFLYLLTEALVFYSTLEVVVITVVSAVFCAVLPYGGWMLERTVVVAGVLGCAFAATMRRSRRRGLFAATMFKRSLPARSAFMRPWPSSHPRKQSRRPRPPMGTSPPRSLPALHLRHTAILCSESPWRSSWAIWLRFLLA